MKVIINTKSCDFGFSEEAINLYNRRTGQELRFWYENIHLRRDPIMIDIVEKLGVRASAIFAFLKVVEIPDGYDYRIDDYDGGETLYLMVREDRLRELIDAGDKDAIVDYVMRSVRGFTGE